MGEESLCSVHVTVISVLVSTIYVMSTKLKIHLFCKIALLITFIISFSLLQSKENKKENNFKNKNDTENKILTF